MKISMYKKSDIPLPFAIRFDGNTSFQSNQSSKCMPSDVCRKGNRDSSSKLQGFELNEVS